MTRIAAPDGYAALRNAQLTPLVALRTNTTFDGGPFTSAAAAAQLWR